MSQKMSNALKQGDQTPVILVGTQDFMDKEIPVVVGGFGENQKVILAKTIAEIHSVEVKYINKLINSNIERFRKNVDFIDLKTGSSKELVLNLGFTNAQYGNAKNIYLLSERGYNKLIKIMDTDLAWEIYEKLVDDYFTLRDTVKEQLDISKYSPEMQAILMHDEKLTKVENRVNKLENSMTLDYGQQNIIQNMVNKKGTQVLGGKTTMAYKLLGQKTFREIYKSLKNSFQVPSYKDIPVMQFEKAKEMVLKWTPSQELNLMIIGANTQVPPNTNEE